MENECCKEFHNKKCDWSISEVCDCPCHEQTKCKHERGTNGICDFCGYKVDSINYDKLLPQ